MRNQGQLFYNQLLCLKNPVAGLKLRSDGGSFGMFLSWIGTFYNLMKLNQKVILFCFFFNNQLQSLCSIMAGYVFPHGTDDDGGSIDKFTDGVPA